MKALAEYSDLQLANELARRSQERANGDDEIEPCDECLWFGAPKKRDICLRGHTMKFRSPSGPRDLNWGFYRRGCKDRKAAA